MQVEQFVMAYYAEQDRLRALLPEGFVSLRPVLRINAEVRDGVQGYVEFNTAGKRTTRAAFLPGRAAMCCARQKRLTRKRNSATVRFPGKWRTAPMA